MLKARPEYFHCRCLSTFSIFPAAWRPQEMKPEQPEPRGMQKP